MFPELELQEDLAKDHQVDMEGKDQAVVMGKVVRLMDKEVVHMAKEVEHMDREMIMVKVDQAQVQVLIDQELDKEVSQFSQAN